MAQDDCLFKGNFFEKFFTRSTSCLIQKLSNKEKKMAINYSMQMNYC